MRDGLAKRLYEQFRWPAILVLALHGVAAVGYRWIGGSEYSWLNCLYMGFITIATIGYGEVVDLQHSPAGRVFTMVIGSAGIALVSYMLAKVTTFLVAGEINLALRRRKMINRIGKLRDHFIICGAGRVGIRVAHELELTGRDFVLIDSSQAAIDAILSRRPETLCLYGDASEDELLTDAGVARAAGVFALAGEDSKNLVITLSAKQLNPAVRIVARCHDIAFTPKLQRVGADAIVSPTYTGSMRIASAMIRPTVVNFLDEMLRSDDALRVEEIPVAHRHAGARLDAVVNRTTHHIVLALRVGDRWKFNPEPDHVLQGGEMIIAVTTPQGRDDLRTRFG